MSSLSTRLRNVFGETSQRMETAFRADGVPGVARALADLAYWRFDPRVRRWYRRMEVERERDRAFDRTYGVDTSAEAQLTDLGVDAKAARAGNGVYRAVWTETFHKALAAVPISLEGATFVDYGCGKGKPLLMASEYPFAEIVGVEYARPLCDVAEKNLAAFRSTAQRCTKLRIVCGDARDFEPPRGPLVCFFFNPFEDDVWRAVLAKLAASWRAAPRPMHLVYVNPRNTREHGDVFRDAAPFVRVARGDDFTVYGAR